MVTDHKTNVDGYTAYYRTAGNPAKPHLIFFNGWGARLNGILGSNRVIEELAKYFYIVSPELPGFMSSDPPREVWKVDDFANFAHKILRPLNLQNPIIMGQSFGGGVAALYVAHYSRNAKCLVLVDAVLAGRKQNWYFNLRYRLPRIAKIISAWYIPLFIKKFIWSWYLGVPYDLLNKNNIQDYTIMPRFQASPHYIPDVDYRQLSLPLLLIWGHRDTWVSDSERAKAVHHEVPNSRLLIVRGPHTVLYRKPRYVINEMVKELYQMAIL